MTPPPAAAARLDSAPLPLPEKKPPSARRPAPARADQPFKGIALILLSTIFLGTSDATSKYLSATLPSVEIAWIRFLVFAMIMVPAMVPGTPIYALRTKSVPLQLMRGTALLGSSLFFITGLRFLPIAEASATGFVSPLFVTALSIIFLAEKVGVRRWIATATGLFGVLVILRPGTGGFIPPRFFRSSRRSAGRHADHDAHDERQGASITIMTYSSIAGVAIMSAMVPFAWVRRPGTTFCLVFWSAWPRRPGSGSWCSRSVMPMRPCWRLSPTRSCYGSAFSASWSSARCPDTWTIVGAGFIVASGLYTAHRERVRRSQLLTVAGEPSPNP